MHGPRAHVSVALMWTFLMGGSHGPSDRATVRIHVSPAPKTELQLPDPTHLRLPPGGHSLCLNSSSERELTTSEVVPSVLGKH